MKVLQMIDVLGFGGAQKVVETFTREATSRGLNTTIVSLKEDFCLDGSDSVSPSVIKGQMTCQLEQAGGKVEVIPARKLLDTRRMQYLVNYIRQERFDVVQTHLTYANILGVYAGKRAGVPVIATLHSISMERALYHPIRETLETIALRYGAQRVVAVGHAVAQAHQRRLGKKKVLVVPNAVPTIELLSETERTRLRKELIGRAESPVLIAVGRLVEPKAYTDLIHAFSILCPAYPDAVLLIVGDGDQRSILEQMIRQKNLEKRVFLLGARGDVPRLLAASDIYVLSSHWEGLPMAVLEAMMAGLPVVATAVGDVPYVVNHSAGILVPPRVPEQLAEAMVAFLSDPIRRRITGVAAREHARQHFGISPWFNRLMEVFQTANYREQNA